jgi:GAF domain-containing protein
VKKLGKIKKAQKRKPVEKRKREVRLAKVLEIVTAAANAAMSLEEVSQSLLEAICIYTGWEVGHAYFLTSIPSYQPGATAAAAYHHHQTNKYFRFWRRFENAYPGTKVGLPAGVLGKGAPQWNKDISDDPRFGGASFSETGVRAGFAFPVFIDKKIVVVLEFFSANTKAPDEKLLKLMSGVGYQIGQVVERKRIEEENAWLLSREHEARSKGCRAR